MNKQLIFLKSFAVSAAVGIIFLSSVAFKNSGNQKFEAIDVQRINIVEPDGTVKMVITNADRFPTGNEKLNNRMTNPTRKKRSGLLFLNEDGIECGGLIYDGQKKTAGHNSGLSLTYDQYDGDQVMQLLTQDYKENDQRWVSSSLIFNDRPANESQATTQAINMELEALGKKDPGAAQKKYDEYKAKGMMGGAPRIMLGKSRSQNNGLFLFDDKGIPKAMFYVDKDNNAKLDFFDDKGNVIDSFPKGSK
jgi:hypothetical protein